MKKLLLVALLAIGVSAASHAQGFQMPTPEEQVATLKTNIKDLTADQETKLKAVYAAAAVRQDSLMKAIGDDFGAMREKMAPLRAAQTAKIKAILTADQQKVFDAIPPRRGFGGGGPGGPGAGGPPRN